MTTLYLVRHGESTWNREGRVQGQQDPPLNANGIRQANLLAVRFAKVTFDAAYSSDLRRAQLTAERLVGERRLSLQTTVAWRERHLGRWEGQLLSDLPALDQEAWASWLTGPRETAPHGGETEVELEQRILAALNGLVAAHPDQTILVVSHGGAIRAALRVLLGRSLHGAANCAYFVVRRTDETWSLVEEWQDETEPLESLTRSQTG